MSDMDSPLLNNRELAKRLGLSEPTFYTRKKRGEFKCFEVKRPLGTFRYSAVLVDAFLAGESVSQYGRRSA
jgi:hypothetical protein